MNRVSDHRAGQFYNSTIGVNEINIINNLVAIRVYIYIYNDREKLQRACNNASISVASLEPIFRYQSAGNENCRRKIHSMRYTRGSSRYQQE